MTTSDPSSALDALLKRPIDQRIREFQYRAAQSSVFGLPVVVLHFFGRQLGMGSDRWAEIMQMLLTGWIVYVGAAGMIFEGLLTLTAKAMADSAIALIASAAFAFSSARVIYQIANSAAVAAPTYFHWAVILLAGWTWGRWGWLSRQGKA